MLLILTLTLILALSLAPSHSTSSISSPLNIFPLNEEEEAKILAAKKKCAS